MATLCPGETTYSAAYAAVPHLLAITTQQGASERAAAIHVATAVEIARHQPSAPVIPADLVLAYATAIESLPSLVALLASDPWDEPTAQVLASALLVGKRQPSLARAMLAIGEDRG